MSIKSRMEFIKYKRLSCCCFKKHTVRNCNVKKPCTLGGCKLPHNVLLHSPHTEVNNEIRYGKEVSPLKTCETATNESSGFFHDNSTTKTLFRYIPVTLHNNT